MPDDKKNIALLEPFKAAEEYACFVNQRLDNLRLKNKKLNYATFSGIRFINGHLENIDFKYSIFHRCYFRATEIRGCDFTGCRFIECDLPHVLLINCTLHYTEWRDTSISISVILSNLPEWPNVAKKLLDSLRINSLTRDDGNSARKYFMLSQKYSRKHYYKIAFDHSKYYRDKYKITNRIKGFFQWQFYNNSRIFWGYGEQPFLLFLWIFPAILMYSIIYLKLDPLYFKLADSDIKSIIKSFISAIYFSAMVFTSNSQDLNTNNIFRFMMFLESISGMIFVGIVAASIYKRISLGKGQ